MSQRRPARIVVVDDEAALAAHLAALVTEHANAALQERETFSVALAGGTTPKAAYALLARPPLASAVDWTRVRFFFGDERCVAPDDDASNYHTAKSALFDVLGIAPGTVHRLRGEDVPEAAARAYATLLQRELGANGDGIPVLDLILLGMGPDGHTASLFPGTNPLHDDALLVRAPYVEKLATYRLTMTPRVLNAARAVVVATAGAAKAPALGAVLDGQRDPTTFPIQILAPRDGELTWLVDRAATTGLAAR